MGEGACLGGDAPIKMTGVLVVPLGVIFIGESPRGSVLRVKTPKDGCEGDQVESQGQENIKSIRSLSGSLVHNLSGYYSKNYSNRTTGKWNKTLSRE